MMDEYTADKKYKALKIPDRQQVLVDQAAQSLFQANAAAHAPPQEEQLYEIEYDSCSIPGVGKFVLKPQKIDSPKKDEIKDLFYKMRNIAREHRSSIDYSRFFSTTIQQDNSAVFYKQGIFMKDFTDDYTENTPFSSYFPYYHMMGYEQLRTYFTWRTKTRQGKVDDTSLSYAFLYIYELLNNIGIENPQDGLDKLMYFWKAFSFHNKALDKYMVTWLKHYHIYYGHELSQTFREFVDKNNLTKHYPQMADSSDGFDLFCAVSKYDIRKSAFFAGDKIKLVTDCFCFVIDKLRQIFSDNGMNFDESIFQPTKKLSVWTPFKSALFFQHLKQPDKRVILSQNEIYICAKNKWTFSTVIASDSGRQLIGYIMKRIEGVLRENTKYKFKLSVNIASVTHTAVAELNDKGLSLEKIVGDAALQFYKETTKTIVRVDSASLKKIRIEALDTLEKLIVPELEPEIFSAQPELSALLSQDFPLEKAALPDNEPAATDTPWGALKAGLTSVEIEALSVLLCSNGTAEIKKFSDKNGIMLEVLVDEINQKAMDFIGDNLMDEDFILYDDYKNQLKELVE